MDWPISRRRYYGTEIPLWHCEKCGYVYVPKPGKYYKPWKESPDIKECPKCKGKKFKGETRIFDTWFDSGSTPLFVLGYYKDPEFYKKNNPCTLRPQGKEIIRTWLYYTLLKTYLLTGKPAFKDVWINHHILDGKGIKMSKSLGNVIDPQEIVTKYGCEPFRLWTVIEGNIANTDMMCSYDRIEGTTKTIIKLWNVAKFISSFKKVKTTKLADIDKSILAELDKLISDSDKSFSKYDFHNPGKAIKHFIWEDLASNYLEIAKKRIYSLENEDKNKDAAIYTLYKILEKLMVLLYPINPLITEEIYSKLYNKEIHKEPYPELEKVSSKINFQDVVRLNTEIWKYKQENGIKNIESLESYKIPKELNPVKEDIALLHNIKNLK
jgi:valyl-tRNA synthetase